MGKVFSHWFPDRAKNWRFFNNKPGRKFLKNGNKWNGNYVTRQRHYKHDKFAYGTYKAEHLNWGQKWNRPIQQLDRLPNVYKGAGLGALYGGLGTSRNGL